MTTTRSHSIINRILLDNSAEAQDPLSNTSLLATAGVQEVLEHIRLQFQPLDADFAEQLHRELHQELLTLPKSWEDGQQGFMQMNLAATTYASNARVDLYLMQQSKTTQDPNSRASPLPKPQPAATTSFQGSGSPPAKAAGERAGFWRPPK